MEQQVGESLPNAQVYQNNFVDHSDGPFYNQGNQQHVEYGGYPSSLGTVSDEFNRITINQEQSRPPVMTQHYYGEVTTGNPITRSGPVNFTHSYNPQSFADSMNSYRYDHPYPSQRRSSSQYLNSSSGSSRLRTLRRRRPMGHLQENTFANSFAGSGIYSNVYSDGGSTYSSAYMGSTDDGLCNIKRKRSAVVIVDNFSDNTSDFTSSVGSNFQSNINTLPLFRDVQTLKLGVCPSFLLTNKCAMFPNCLLSHSRKDFEDASSVDSQGQVQQNIVVPVEECKHFSASGKCPVGFHCNFLHKIPPIELKVELKSEETPTTTTTTTTTEEWSPANSEDIFKEFFTDYIDDEIDQCLDIEKEFVYN
uniref:C3H1-type domain-containing protein n=1 Tax=Strongyloides papillosus TaxID=174720 RepID=A0A0N5B2L4_STREA